MAVNVLIRYHTTVLSVWKLYMMLKFLWWS